MPRCIYLTVVLFDLLPIAFNTALLLNFFVRNNYYYFSLRNLFYKRQFMTKYNIINVNNGLVATRHMFFKVQALTCDSRKVRLVKSTTTKCYNIVHD